MLVPVDLMSIVSAGSSSAQARDAGNIDVGGAASWLLAADADASSASGKDVINSLFRSYANDGEANPAARFAADLKALLSAHGVSLTSDQALLPAGAGLIADPLSGEIGDLPWSVDELLQMATGPLPGGNDLPLDDQTLPSVLSNWLAALSAPAAEATASVEATPTSVGNAAAAGNSAALLLGGSGTTGDTAASQSATGISALMPAGGAAPSSGPGLADVLGRSPGSGELRTTVGATTVGGSARAQADSGVLLSDAAATRAPDAGLAGASEAMTLQSPLPTDVTRQATESTQVNPGSQKIASDAANASAFRSIQFNQPASGDSGSAADGASVIQSELSRTSAPLERNQAIASQLTASVATGAAADGPAATSTSQLFNPADGSAVMNRAEQRMFATESAQQAQAQAAQQTANRTGEGLPRFAMDTAFGQQGWSDSLGRQLLVMSSQGVSSAQIRLDPPELGSLTVKIQVSADQQTNVSFVSQHAVVREALEQQLNRLQDLFRDQGLNLQDVSVSDQSPQQRDGEGGGQHGGNGGSGRDEQDPGVGEPVMVRSESLIDFYA